MIPKGIIGTVLDKIVQVDRFYWKMFSLNVQDHDNFLYKRSIRDLFIYPSTFYHIGFFDFTKTVSQLQYVPYIYFVMYDNDMIVDIWRS